MAASAPGGAAAPRVGAPLVRVGGDTLSRLLEDLCRPGALERSRDGERHLCEYVEAEARDLSAEAFGKFMQEVYARLHAMVKRCARDHVDRGGGGGGERLRCVALRCVALR